LPEFRADCLSQSEIASRFKEIKRYSEEPIRWI
jgi:hypothetical protein